MIHIKKINKEIIGDYSYAVANISISRESCAAYEEYCNFEENRYFTKYLDESYVDTTSGDTKLWFAVENKYGDNLCLNRADGFVLALLHFAMSSGSDIISDIPVSSGLLYNIRTQIIPHLCVKKFHEIRVEAPAFEGTDPNTRSANGAGTGMSCGIDSFFTVWENTRETIPNDYKVKYLTFFNVGAINNVFAKDVSLERRNKIMLELSESKGEQARQIAKELGMEFVFINSNISDYYRGMIINSAHYRNCGAAMVINGLWSTYYYSSGGLNPVDTRFDLCEDPAYCEAMLLEWFSSNNMRFSSAGHAYERMRKTEILSEYPVAKKYLCVCDQEKNCGNCGKCKRTISTLISLKKLDEFSNCFDIDEIKKEFTHYKQYIFLKRRERFYSDIYKKAIENNVFSMLDKLVFGLESIPFELIKNNRIWKNWRYRKYKEKTGVMR